MNTKLRNRQLWNIIGAVTLIAGSVVLFGLAVPVLCVYLLRAVYKRTDFTDFRDTCWFVLFVLLSLLCSVSNVAVYVHLLLRGLG